MLIYRCFSVNALYCTCDSDYYLIDMLRTKSIYTAPTADDGLRISIMSRHTLSDGLTPDPMITPEQFSIWMPQYSPSPKAVGAYYRGEIDWDSFSSTYKDKLHHPEMQPPVLLLAGYALARTITLLCVEEHPEYCHRRLLAETCIGIFPELENDIQ
jgi:uncharacterized protein YeaO (DUF488 family)